MADAANRETRGTPHGDRETQQDTRGPQSFPERDPGANPQRLVVEATRHRERRTSGCETQSARGARRAPQPLRVGPVYLAHAEYPELRSETRSTNAARQPAPQMGALTDRSARICSAGCKQKVLDPPPMRIRHHGLEHRPLPLSAESARPEQAGVAVFHTVHPHASRKNAPSVYPLCVSQPRDASQLQREGR